MYDYFIAYKCIHTNLTLCGNKNYFCFPHYSQPHQWQNSNAQNWQTGSARFEPWSRLSTQTFEVFRVFLGNSRKYRIPQKDSHGGHSTHKPRSLVKQSALKNLQQQRNIIIAYKIHVKLSKSFCNSKSKYHLLNISGAAYSIPYLDYVMQSISLKCTVYVK